MPQNPSIEDKLYEEPHSILDKDNNVSNDNNISDNNIKIGTPTIEDISKLNMLKKYCKNLRLYPPVWTIGRQVINDYMIDKYTLLAGSIVLMSQYLIHRDPRYFPDPNVF